VLLEEELAQVREGEAGVEDVFDYEDILSLDGVVEIFDELDGAGGTLAFAVAGSGDKVEGGVDLNGPGQVCEKGRRALQDAYHDQLFPVEVVGDLCAYFSDALGNLLTGEKDFEALIGCGSHANSIARIGDVRECANQDSFWDWVDLGMEAFEDAFPGPKSRPGIVVSTGTIPNRSITIS
jgi:hypothetical protein